MGDPKPSDAPEAAAARALGYQNEDEWRTDPEFGEKYVRAKCKLFAKFGVDLETADGHEIAVAAKRIHAGLPVSYETKTLVKPIHDDVWQCRPLELGPVTPRSLKSRVFTLNVRRALYRESREMITETIGRWGEGKA